MPNKKEIKLLDISLKINSVYLPPEEDDVAELRLRLPWMTVDLRRRMRSTIEPPPLFELSCLSVSSSSRERLALLSLASSLWLSRLLSEPFVSSDSALMGKLI